MSVIKNYSDNPKDGIASFNKVRFYEADDSTGTNAVLLTTLDIDTTNIGVIDQGFTSFVYSSGSTSKYYASTWYNSNTGAETDKSTWVQGGTDRWDTMFMNLMKDTTSSVWSASDRSEFKKAALESLYPDFFYETVDTSLTVDNDSTPLKVYTLPFGVFAVSEVGVGDPNNEATYSFSKLTPENWNIEQNKLVLNSLSGLTDNYPFRLVCCKKYMEVGEVPTRLDPLVMLKLRQEAYMQMVDDYPRFLKWARLQKGTRVTFEGIKLLVKQLENSYNTEKEKAKDMARSVAI